MQRRVAVRGIITLNNQLLGVRQKPYNDVSSNMNGAWCTPGGGLDIGEPLVAGLIRELEEETGVTPIVGQLLFIQQFVYNDLEQLEFFFHVENGQDYQSIDLAATSHGAHEIAQICYLDPQSTNILPKFLQEVDIPAAISSQATTVFNYI